MSFKTITSTQNPVVKHIVSLAKRSEREKCGEFVIEGDKLLLEAVSSGIECTTILADKFAAERLSELLSALALKGTDICIATDEVIKKCSQLEQPQGIIAAAKLPPRADALSALAEGGAYIILDGLQDPGNLGTIIRTAEAMGIDGLIVSGDTVDVYNLKTLRGSMGSAFRMKISFANDISEVILKMRQKGYKVYAAALSDNSMDIRYADFTGSVAVVIGNEGKGLSDKVIKACQSSVIIPMAGKTESLNASVAAALFMWEMRRCRLSSS